VNGSVGKQNHYDVIIVGGGLAGAALACLLAPEYHVLILDKILPDAIPPDNAPISAKALALSPASHIILQRTGVIAALAPHFSFIKQIHVSEKNSCATVRMRAEDVQQPALGYVIDSQRLMAVLQQQALTHANTTWLKIEQVQSQQQKQGRVHLTIQAQGKAQTITTSLLVAADGTQSHVAQLAGLNFIHQSVEQHALLLPVELSTEHHGLALECFTEQGTWAFLPLQEKSGMVVWTDEAKVVEPYFAAKQEAYLALIQHYLPSLAQKIMAIGKATHYPLKVGKVSQLYRGQVVAIGNAAQTLHPIAAQGFNLALRDIYDLAQRMNNDVCDMMDPTLWLPDYVSTRWWDQHRIGWLTHSLQSGESKHSIGRKCMRSIGLRACALFPPLKHALMRAGMGL
jgi:2-octaprenyl-6-methoxyphenol hydroxylase